MKHRAVSTGPKYVVLLLFTIICIFPLLFAGLTSMKSVEEYTESTIAFPDSLSFVNYETAFRNLSMVRYLINSVLMVGIAMIIYFFVCTSAGFAFGLLNFKGRILMFSLVLFLMIFPQMVIASQIYRIAVALRLLNTRGGIILIWAAYFSPFGAYIMTTYYSSVPRLL